MTEQEAYWFNRGGEDRLGNSAYPFDQRWINDNEAAFTAYLDGRGIPHQ